MSRLLNAIPSALVQMSRYAVYLTVCACDLTHTAYRRRSTSCVSQSSCSRRNSVAPSQHCVVFRRHGHGLSVRSPARRPRSTSMVSSVSSCETARCWTHVLGRSTTSGLRPRPGPATSTVNQRSPSSSAQRVRRASVRSSVSPAASRSYPVYFSVDLRVYSLLRAFCPHRHYSIYTVCCRPPRRLSANQRVHIISMSICQSVTSCFELLKRQATLFRVLIGYRGHIHFSCQFSLHQ